MLREVALSLARSSPRQTPSKLEGEQTHEEVVCVAPLLVQLHGKVFMIRDIHGCIVLGALGSFPVERLKVAVLLLLVLSLFIQV